MLEFYGELIYTLWMLKKSLLFATRQKKSTILMCFQLRDNHIFDRRAPAEGRSVSHWKTSCQASDSFRYIKIISLIRHHRPRFLSSIVNSFVAFAISSHFPFPAEVDNLCTFLCSSTFEKTQLIKFAVIFASIENFLSVLWEFHTICHKKRWT